MNFIDHGPAVKRQALPFTVLKRNTTLLSPSAHHFLGKQMILARSGYGFTPIVTPTDIIAEQILHACKKCTATVNSIHQLKDGMCAHIGNTGWAMKTQSLVSPVADSIESCLLSLLPEEVLTQVNSSSMAM